MKATQKLGNPIFIISVLILVINDWYLKQTYHNALTGKLSDFAGLFAFPFLLSALFPRKAMSMYVFASMLFVAWKSPLVQPIIDGLTSLGIPTHRTVDYTDYVALLILPVSFCVFKRSANYNLRPILLYSIVAFSSVAFMATTRPPGNDTKFTGINKTYTFNFSKKELIARLNKLQMDYVYDINKYCNCIVDFDNKTKSYYYTNQGDTVAWILNYTKVKDADTVILKTVYTAINIAGNDTSSVIKLLSTSWYVPKKGKSDYKAKSIKLFELAVVKKIERN